MAMTDNQELSVTTAKSQFERVCLYVIMESTGCSEGEARIMLDRQRKNYLIRKREEEMNQSDTENWP